MEYRTETGTTYTTCGASSTLSVGAAGTYYVRMKAAAPAGPSENVAVVVPAFEE